MAENNRPSEGNIEKSRNSDLPRTTWTFLVWLGRRTWIRRKWWLFPVWVVLVALAIVLFLTGNGALLPAIYLAF
jgi:hypothetical protein